MLRDRLRKLMADWGSHPAAPMDKNIVAIQPRK